MRPELRAAIVQDADSGRVLMLAWMNDEARRLTEETGDVHFWSRSRNRLWKKGETSGHVLRLRSITADCDEDTYLVQAVPAGPACHTGALTCFGNTGPEPQPSALHALATTILARKVLAPGSASYVRQLLDAGMQKMLAKLEEEATELGVELREGPRDRVIAEAADVVFHLLVALAARDVGLADVEGELDRRAGLSGLEEKARRKKK